MAIVTEAIVLQAFDYLETSRILRLATREAGVLSVIARGARRSTRRFGSAMDLFALGTATVAHRPGRDLHTLEAFDVTAGHAALAGDLDRFLSASMLSELVLRTMSEADQGAAYGALAQAFERLLVRAGERARVAGLASAWRLVASLGFSPALESCARCHADFDVADDTWFTAASGGAVCDACRRQSPAGRRIPGEAREAIRQWISGSDDVVPEAAAQQAHVRLLREFVRHYLTDETELRAFEAWNDRFRGRP